MLQILITFLTFVLIIICLFMMLVILMQRASANAGLGSAFGGGAAESAFGADTTNVLVKATKWSAFAFFGLSLVLYLLFIAQTSKGKAEEDLNLPDIAVETPAGDEMTADEAAQTVVTEAESMADEAVAEEPMIPETETVPAP